MNRIFLIGNGFDCAHGMKTTYTDFMLDYIRTSFIIARKEGRYDDHLFFIHKNKDPFPNIEGLDSIAKYTQLFEPLPQVKLNRNVSWQVKGNFTRKLIQAAKQYRWVDIEDEYHTELHLISEMEKEKRDIAVAALNAEVQTLLQNLSAYLSVQKRQGVAAGYNEIFSRVLTQPDVRKSNTMPGMLPYRSLVVNFNYTETPQIYFNPLSSLNLDVLNIHGKINDPDNPLIFGYGNEENEHVFLKMRNDDFRRYSKRVSYSVTSHNNTLMDFADGEEFQAVILGHSCGLSDEALLGDLFKHDNCKTIRIYYYKHSIGDNFQELNFAIERIFGSSRAMAQKLIAKAHSFPMPQWNG